MLSNFLKDGSVDGRAAVVNYVGLLMEEDYKGMLRHCIYSIINDIDRMEEWNKVIDGLTGKEVDELRKKLIFNSSYVLQGKSAIICDVEN